MPSNNNFSIVDLTMQRSSFRMQSGRLSKQAMPYRAAPWLNYDQYGTVIGGNVTAAPGNVGASQFQQNVPGDRFILAPADALAMQNNNTGGNNNGILYTGIYRFGLTNANATASVLQGRALFWNPNAAGNNNNSAEVADALFQVTPDGNSAYGVSLFAGVAICNIALGNYCIFQEAGKARVKFRATISGTPAVGAGVYLINPPVANNNTDNGTFDQITGQNVGAGPIAAANFATTIDQYLVAYVGVAET